MAVLNAFTGAKLESLPLRNAGASTSAPIAVFCNPGRGRMALIQKGSFNFAVRCESATTDVVAQTEASADSANVALASSLSALQQLKTSAADSMYILIWV